MRVLICGDRNWDDYALIYKTLLEIHKVSAISVVIEGEARGADNLGRQAAIALSIPVAKFPADWHQYGKAAGPIRNCQMLREGKPDLVLAFHSDIDNSKGTKDMVMVAREAGVEVRIIQGESHA